MGVIKPEAWNVCFVLMVRAQLELNDAMTEVDLIKSNQYQLAQYGEDKPNGKGPLTFQEAVAREADESTTSMTGADTSMGTSTRMGTSMGTTATVAPAE